MSAQSPLSAGPDASAAGFADSNLQVVHWPLALISMTLAIRRSSSAGSKDNATIVARSRARAAPLWLTHAGTLLLCLVLSCVIRLVDAQCVCTCGTNTYCGCLVSSCYCPQYCPASNYYGCYNVGSQLSCSCTPTPPVGATAATCAGMLNGNGGSCALSAASGYTLATGSLTLTCNNGRLSAYPTFKQCTARYFCLAGSTAMTLCTAGKYCATAGLSTPTGTCPAGKYSAAGASACSTCTAGKYSRRFHVRQLRRGPLLHLGRFHLPQLRRRQVLHVSGLHMPQLRCREVLHLWGLHLPQLRRGQIFHVRGLHMPQLRSGPLLHSSCQHVHELRSRPDIHQPAIRHVHRVRGGSVLRRRRFLPELRGGQDCDQSALRLVCELRSWPTGWTRCSLHHVPHQSTGTSTSLKRVRRVRCRMVGMGRTTVPQRLR